MQRLFRLFCLVLNPVNCFLNCLCFSFQRAQLGLAGFNAWLPIEQRIGWQALFKIAGGGSGGDRNNAVGCTFKNTVAMNPLWIHSKLLTRRVREEMPNLWVRHGPKFASDTHTNSYKNKAMDTNGKATWIVKRYRRTKDPLFPFLSGTLCFGSRLT